MSEQDYFTGLVDDHAVIVIGGHPPDRRALEYLPVDHVVICADSGLDHALRLGMTPMVVIGDMDSVGPDGLARARSLGCAIHEHPADKDFTDTELALDHAVAMGFRHVTLVWGGGDRIDHVLGVFAALGHERLANVHTLEAWIASDHVAVVHAGHELVADHNPDTTISLVPIGSRDAIVTTSGLRWNLDQDVLTADRARGVSNLVTSPPFTVRCDRGVVAVITPERLSGVESRRKVK